jgi:hypothetical protein
VNQAAYHAILNRLGVEPADPARPDPAALAPLLEMPLEVFAREGQPLEVRVAWWPVTLFFVPDVRHAEMLWREGIGRERVWTGAELIALLAGAPWTADALCVVMVARRELDGEVVAARRRDENPSLAQDRQSPWPPGGSHWGDN